jgi:hypothetical protein
MIEWKATTSGINFKGPKYLKKPIDKMFKKTLIELVEGIGSNQVINVQVRKIFPERRDDRLYARFFACANKF